MALRSYAPLEIRIEKLGLGLSELLRRLIRVPTQRRGNGFLELLIEVWDPRVLQTLQLQSRVREQFLLLVDLPKKQTDDDHGPEELGLVVVLRSSESLVLPRAER